MTLSEFNKKIKALGIDCHIVRFNDSISDDIFFVNYNYGRYIVGYRERGVAYDVKPFTGLGEALDYLFSLIE